MGKRVLVVDDNVTLAGLIEEFLRMSGHQVTTCNDAVSALREVARDGYEVLITDLNISGPGDGYILAGASRLFHPETLILLLTGLPDLESAWRSIQSTVDRLLLKPVNPAELQALVASLESPDHTAPARFDLGSFIEAHRKEIMADWLVHVEADPLLSVIPMDRVERLDHLEDILLVIAHHLHHPSEKIYPSQAEAARRHGRDRREHGYHVAAVLRDASHLRQSITRLLTARFFELDPVHVLADLYQMNLSLDENMGYSLSAYVGE